MKFAYLIEPPFNYHNDHGKITGCDVELAKYIFEQLNADCFEPVETEFAELLPGVASGQWKMTTGLFGTKERMKTASFSRPIWALPDGLLVERGNPMALSGYKSVAQNPDCTLAVIRDQFQHRSAVKYGVPDRRIAIFETYTEAAHAIKTGKANAYASVGRAHTGFIKRNPDLTLEVVTVPYTEKQPAFGCFAVNKADKDFLHTVNDILDAYIGSTPHRKMVAKYGFTDAEVDLLIA